jgi:DNA primase
MGKISPPSIKYIIKVKFLAEGVIEKPDIIGAVFGQTEGLLGEELELRDLQKKGKIGRIDANLEVNDSKTSGIIEIPTSIDKAETTIIAAAVETIDRIGPCDAKFEILDIEDVRTSKREYILERAKKLMSEMQGRSPESREMEQQVIDHAKTAKIQGYGTELLPAGPNIDSSSEIIVVEGRADVLTLLRAGIKNAIAMNGSMMPKTIKQLSEEKQVTLFVDGDRGGLLIVKDATTNGSIDFIARAPDGKEVEELTEKEINICLRAKMTIEEFQKKYLDKNGKEKTREVKEENEVQETSKDQKEVLENYFNELSGTRGAFIITARGQELVVQQKIPSSELFRVLNALKRRDATIFALVIDGTVTQSIISSAEELGCKVIVAKNFGATSNSIELMSF